MYTIDDLNRDVSDFFGGPALEATASRHYKGGSNAAVNYQKKTDQELKDRIATATAKINEIFDNSNRDAAYQSQRDAVYQLNADEVNRQAKEAERANRFGLAQAGLLGGSADIDSNAELNRRTNQGLLNAQGIADDSAASLRTSDEQTRQNLLSLANSGQDPTSVATMATNQLASNLENASADKAAAAVGSLFSDLSNAYLTRAQAANMAGNSSLLANLYKNAYGNGSLSIRSGSYQGS